VCSDHLSEPCFIRSEEWSEPVFGSDERTIQSGLPNLKLTSRLKVKTIETDRAAKPSDGENLMITNIISIFHILDHS